MKNKKVIGIVAFIAIAILAVEIIISGFSIYIYGVCNFNTKYFDTPKIALDKADEFEIEAEIGIVEINPHNVVFLAKTKDGEIFAAEMKSKDNKYFFAGDFSAYNYYSFESDETDVNFVKGCLYKENGLFDRYFEYDVSKIKPVADNSDLTVKELKTPDGDILYFVYRVLPQE